MVNEKWAPVIQQAIRSGVVLTLCLIFVPQIISILDIVQQRMLSGSSFSIGPNGLSLGEAPKIPEKRPLPLSLAPPTGLGGGAPVKGPGPSGVLHGDISIVSLENMYYLIHAAKKGHSNQYDVIVRIGSHNDNAYQYIDKVVYHLHDTFDQPIREISSPTNNFELTFSAWGQFELKTDIYIHGSETPIKLTRFLNF